MLSCVARIMLTSSAIAPVGFIYSWVAYTQGENTVAAIAFAGAAILVILCTIVLIFSKRNLEATPFKPSSIEAADRESIGFMMLYLLPLFTDRINTLNWSLWIPTVAIFAVITATGYSYHFNPLLGLLGWHFYKVCSEEGVTYVLITRRHLKSAAQSLRVGQLTEYILIDLGENK